MQSEMFAEVRKFVPQLPAEPRWARAKRWELAYLKDPTDPICADDFPAAADDFLLEFCGDYRCGDGGEAAAQSGRHAAETLLRKIKKAEGTKLS